MVVGLIMLVVFRSRDCIIKVESCLIAEANLLFISQAQWQFDNKKFLKLHGQSRNCNILHFFFKLKTTNHFHGNKILLTLLMVLWSKLLQLFKIAINPQKRIC